MGRAAARLALQREIAKDDTKPVLWKKAGTQRWRESKGAYYASGAILAAAAAHVNDVSFRTREGAKLRTLTTETPPVPSVPALARATTGYRRAARFWTEMHLVFPEIKSLGLYVPRTLKDGSGYYSEHAWAAAQDWGMSNGKGGYITDISKLKPFLAMVNRYIVANFDRIGVDKTIFDGRQWYGEHKVLPYTGSDSHDTHTHTQFANHGGKKPPWL